ncbi:MAG: phage tail assembly protein [Geobacter sp.]|jgi:hypothetical protein
MSEIVLKYPFMAAGKKVEKLTLRRPTVKDLRTVGRFGDTDEDKEVGLIANLAGLIPEDMDQMDAADYKVLQDSFRAMLAE